MSTPSTTTIPVSPVPAAVPSRRKPGRGLLWLGVALPLLGLLGFIGQLWLRHLTLPWYAPVASTAGVLLLGAALWRGRTLWRILALLLIVLLAAGQWSLIVMLRLPDYAGPVTVGHAFPAFSTLKADGTPFSEQDLLGPQNTVLVAFRGRW